MRRVNVRFSLQYHTAYEWTTKNPILLEGEPGVESDTNKFKIGDGVTVWTALDYYLDEEGTLAMLQDLLDAYAESDLALMGHIHSDAPHPVYDDGPSFVLLYENAKV